MAARSDLDEDDVLSESTPLALEIPIQVEAPTSSEPLLAGKYVVGEIVGQGPHGVVYEGVNAWTGRRVVIKRMLAGATQAQTDALLNRARTVARLVHAHVAEIIDVGTDDAKNAYVAREHLAGKTLEEVLSQRGALPLGEAVALFAPLADALALAHHAGIVHGDIKPRNIRVVEVEGRTIAKLLDFGADETILDLIRRSAPQDLLTALRYSAPEVIRDAPDRGAGSDVWSLAACFFEAITGRPLVASRSPHDAMREIVELTPPRPSAHAEGVGDEVDAVVLRALRAQTGERTPTMSAFASDLVGLVGSTQPVALKGRSRLEPDSTDAFRFGGPLATATPPLRLGLVSTASGFDLPNFEAALDQHLGRAVHVLRIRTYADLVSALIVGEVDLAWLAPAAYVHARRQGTVRLLCSTIRTAGATFRSALLGRRGVIERASDARGKRAAWVDAWSAAGYLVPRAMLERAGIVLSQDLRAQGFVGGHDEVVTALERGSADLGATFCHLGADGRLHGPFEGRAGVVVVEVSDPIPGDTLCSAPHVLDAEAEAMSLLLVNAAKNIAPLISATDLVFGDPSAYDDLERMTASK